MNDSLAVAEVLVKAGADATICDNYGQSTLDLAESPEMRQLLARVWPQDHPLRLHALANADLADEVADAVAAGADVNTRDKEGRTPLFWAIEKDSLTATEVLVEAGADVNTRDKEGRTPLFWASEKNSLASAEVLVKAGADVTIRDNRGRSTLDLAYSPEMRHLLARAWLQDHPLRLHMLAKADLIDEVVDAVAAGADVDARDKWDQTPLFWAIENDSLAVAKVLAEAGADVDARDEDSRTPLHWAIEKNSLATAKVLIEAGADVNARDEWDHTPIFCAIQKNSLTATEVLIEAGADVNARDEGGWTPLFYAIKNGNLDVAGVLADAGTDVTICDNDGQSTLDWARSPEMRQLLARVWPQDHPR